MLMPDLLPSAYISSSFKKERKSESKRERKGGRGKGRREKRCGRKGGGWATGICQYNIFVSLYSEHSCGSTHIKEFCQFGYIFHYSPSTFWLIAIYLGNHGGKKSSLFFKVNRFMIFSFLCFLTSSFSFLLQSS